MSVKIKVRMEQPLFCIVISKPFSVLGCVLSAAHDYNPREPTSATDWTEPAPLGGAVFPQWKHAAIKFGLDPFCLRCALSVLSLILKCGPLRSGHTKSGSAVVS